MKKLLMGCMAALAALISLVGCEQDKAVYSGPNYLMFSDTIYYCPCLLYTSPSPRDTR